MITAEIIKTIPHVQCYPCKSYFIRHNASTDACDMIDGACACGAWHNSLDHICASCNKLVRVRQVAGTDAIPPPPAPDRPLQPDHDTRTERR